VVEEDLEAIGMKVRQVEAFISARQKRLDDELKDVTDRTVECPLCGEGALVLGWSRRLTRGPAHVADGARHLWPPWRAVRRSDPSRQDRRTAVYAADAKSSRLTTV
jgi:hypothetical protein